MSNTTTKLRNTVLAVSVLANVSYGSVNTSHPIPYDLAAGRESRILSVVKAEPVRTLLREEPKPEDTTAIPHLPRYSLKSTNYVLVAQAGGSSYPQLEALVPAPGSTNLTFTPQTLVFGDVIVGQRATLPVKLKNTTTNAISVSTTMFFQSPGVAPNFDFTVSGINNGTNVPANGSIILKVTFAPTITSPIAGKFIITALGASPTESLYGSGVNAHSEKLGWNSSPGANGYYVYRSSEDGGPFSRITPSPVLSTNYLDTTVQAGQTYFWAVSAVNTNILVNGTYFQESQLSNEAIGSINYP